MRLADRVQSLSPSLTLAISAKAKAMKADGIDVINFSAGEPDFDTPDHVKAAAKQAINEGRTKYTPVPGIPELKHAIIKKYQDTFNVAYDDNQIIVSAGGKQVLYNIFQSLLNPNDEVIIPAPYWVSYPEQVRLAQGVPIILPTTHHTKFKMTPDELNAKISPKTKLIILNSPANPTGTVYTAIELQKFADVLRRHPHVYIISDDVYEKILFDNQTYTNILHVAPDLRERTIIVNAVSKTYAMTGWRVGYGLARADIISAMNKIQGQSTSGACSIAQYAAAEAIQSNQDWVTESRSKFEARRNALCTALEKVPGVSFAKPSGAFYAFPDFSAYYGQKKEIVDSLSMCDYLLDTAKVATVPGVAFGEDRCIRISFAINVDTIQEGIRRIHTALS